MRFDWLNTEICVTLARNAADGGYTKKFVAHNVAEVGRDSTAAILHATNFGVDTRWNSAIVRNIARNIATCIRTFRPITLIWASLERSFPPAEIEYR